MPRLTSTPGFPNGGHPCAKLRLSLFATIFFLCAGCHTLDSRDSKTGSDDRENLQAAGREWDRLFNLGDAEKLAALYAENAVSMPPNLPTLTGRQSLQKDFQEFFAANSARHETMVEDLLIEGTMSIERARYRLTVTPKTGGPQTVETGRHVECRRKINGQWKIVVEIWNTETAPK